MKGYVLGGETFASKKAVVGKCRGIIKAGIGVGDDSFLRDLLNLHRDVASKVGPGVQGFEIRACSFGTRGFWVRRVDGTCEDFSFLKCLTHSDNEADTRAAFREAVRPQIEAVKSSAGRTFVCPVSGNATRIEDGDVDHEAPLTFKNLFDYFAKFEGLDLTMEYSREEGVGVRKLIDPSLSLRWQEFHAVNARLRLISRRAHKRLSKS